MRRTPTTVILAALISCLLPGCTPERAVPESADTAGGPRIVTLAPHLAELVYAVGAGEMLVGVSAYSNFPDDVAQKPQVGDAFMLDLERLALLDPDLLLAWSSGTPAHTVEDLRARGYRVEVIRSRSLADVDAAVRRIGVLTGHESQAESVAAQFRADMDRLHSMHGAGEPISVFYQISDRPLYTVSGDHYVSELIELCGGRNIFDDLSDLAPLVAEESVLARNPEVLLAGRINADEDLFGEWQRWPDLAANVYGNHFYVPADELARPTPRLLQAGETICEALEQARRNRTAAGRS